METNAQVGDFIKKDGQVVRIDQIDLAGETFFTSDGGCIGFNEVGRDDVLLESEIV